MSSLTPDELELYQRHLLIDNFTEHEQQKLTASRMLVIGAGGLGTPVLLYLAGAGVGCIGIAEYDQVEASNIHRQIIYNRSDIGSKKIDLATKKIRLLNPQCRINTYATKWEKQNAFDIAAEYQLIIDCSDNYKSRYLTDAVSAKLSIPFVYGAVYQMEGQVSVFNYSKGKCYSELFPPQENRTENTQSGVLGPVAGIAGSAMAAEAIKIVTGIGNVLTGKMLSFSARYNRFKVLDLD